LTNGNDAGENNKGETDTKPEEEKTREEGKWSERRRKPREKQHFDEKTYLSTNKPPNKGKMTLGKE
jgi:hypothetical protein